MARNIGWREPAKSNAIKLLEALLSLADGWELDDCELKAAVQVEWVSENKLRVTGKDKDKKKSEKRETTVEIGTTKKALVKLVEKAGKSLEFPKRQQGEGSSREDREAEAVQTVFDCLRELGVFEEDPNNTRKNQGYWKFTLKLKHQTASLKENLAEIQLKWKEQNPEEPPPPPTNINWREVCQTRLDNQKRLLKNALTSGNPLDLYGPLGLVEPKPKEEIRHGCDVSPEEGSRFYQLSETQITKTYNQPNEFFEQVLRQGQSKNSHGRRLAITGEPGAGKTTLCYQIANWILEQNLGVPILIRLADIGSKPLGEFLLEDWLRHAANEVEAAPPEWKTAFREVLKSGDVWLLLDGVDEMAVASPLAAINQQLAEGWTNKVRVVLTCRLNLWDADKNALWDFDVYRNLDFDEKQVKEFIQKWFADNQQCEGLLQELAQPNRERINDLIKNPLRLALLCRTWKLRQGSLPDTKAGLYERLVEAHYIWKDENQEFAISREKQIELNRAFGELAKQAIDSEDFRFRLRESFIKGFLGEPNQDFSLFWWALKLGWLNRVGLPLTQEEDSDRAVYAFFHPTFQEYFAACAISDWDFFLPREHKDRPVQDKDNPNKYKPYRIFDPHWKEVIFLWLGRSDVEKDQKEKLLKALVEFKDGCGGFYKTMAYSLFLDYLYDLSTRDEFDIEEFVDCNFKATMRSFLKLSFDELAVIDLLRNLGPLYVRSWYLYKLFDSMPEVKWLDKALSLDKSDLTILTTISRADDINILIEYLKIYQGTVISRETLIRIIEISESTPTTVISTLSKALYISQDEHTNRLVSWILGEIAPGNLEAFNALIKLLQTSQDEITRLGVLYSLEKIIQQGELVQTLFESFKDCLTDKVYKNDRDLYDYCHKFLWHYAQNMNYVDFARTWHHPEVRETTGFSLTPNIQHLNVAELPQLLHVAVTNNEVLRTIDDLLQKIICIDGRKFENPDNPASEIYAEMVMQGCPERQNGEPETMQALKVYCQLKCQGVFLIFYEDTSGETPQGFSPTFLSSLSKFDNARRICVVSEQPCNLQTFSPTQPNLVTDIVSWIREKILED
ncbi:MULTISPECIES: NACHT domain-containing protein [Cyanophyceae]|uniref:NACHT C-terminal alpha/beta 1 domain-containing protein n=1 Tax=Cyanophyceae TaxID=3028117 RepID=UPI0016853661|nr:NACHT domain-containing protein [Trichocoleus sp. FACHB-832]MBD1905451.1 NACHT domain-containing protein [Trichocoleus sp. FACHB-832]